MKEIKAKEGMYLTQSGEVEDRIFITAIKGMNVNKLDWKEVTLEEKEAWESKNSKELSELNY